jgi:hypothetical protein
MQPGVNEHGTVAGGKDEAITVEPFRVGGIALEGLSKEHCADFCRAKRQTEVAGGALMHRVHGEAAGFVGGFGEEGVIHEKREYA